MTARRREETLQETPVAVSAFTGENLQELGLNNIADLTRVVPNVDMYSGNGTAGNGNVFIRGIGQLDPTAAVDPGVGVCGKAGQGVPVGIGQPSLKFAGLTVGGTAV